MSAEIPHAFGGAEAFIIEIDDVAAGLALRERGGFRFVAADRRFHILDGSRFKRVAQVEQAARNLWRAQTRRG
jgi:hypothetical protein